MEENNIYNIGPNELVFNLDKKSNIYSGGFNVNSIMMKAGISPITTLNTSQDGGGTNKVSDLFKNLVVPSYALSYSNMNGGEYKDDTDSDSDSDIDDDLHDKLLNLVRESDSKLTEGKKKKKFTKKQKNTSKNSGTKKIKKKENKE
jgi:hypothetical protein